MFYFQVLFLSHHSSSAEIPFLCAKISYVQFFLFLIMSHQSQNREILAIKSHQTQWKLMGTHEILAIKTSSNPLESYGIHAILTIKSHQTQWNLMGSMRF